MAESDTIPVWKKLYQIVSGSNSNVSDDTVDSVLVLCKKKLVNLLLEYKPYTKQSFEEWKKSSESMSIYSDDEMCSFIHCLSKELDLDVNVAWLVICNYLIFEYYDKVQELRSIIKYEANAQSFIEHVWYFYSADRMFLLKTLRFIYEKVTDKNHKSSDLFNVFLECIDKKLIWDNLLKVFETLVSEIDKDKSSVVSSDTLSKWINRNNREQTEVLMLMIHTINYVKVSGEELLQVIKIFMRHGFTTHPIYQPRRFVVRSKDLFDIKSAKIGVLLTVINKYWQNPGIFKSLPKDIEKNLEMYQLQGENSLVFFIWVIFKVTQSSDNLEYCNDAMYSLSEKTVFKTLQEILCNEIFANCESGELIFESASNLMREFINITSDCRVLYEQEGVVQILCELLKRPKLKALDYCGPLFEVALDMFPMFLDNFLDICKALIQSGLYYEKIMKLLQNLPTFCTELEWYFLGDSIELDNTRPLFLDNDKEFIVPEGTVAEKCVCYDIPYTKFIYRVNFFAVIEQYFRALTRWTRANNYINEMIMEYVIGSTKFLTFLVDYDKDFSKNPIFKRVINRLDCSTITYSEGPFKRFDLFTAYFEFKCKLISEENFEFTEVYSPVVRKQVLPYISDYPEAERDLTLCYAHSSCILYKFLKEEQITSDHTLLVIYVEFIAKIVEKNILHKEVQYPGVWFLLSVVFSFHQQWTYKDPQQETKILKACMSTFVNIFQRYSDNLDYDDYEVARVCVAALLNNKTTVSSLTAYFIKDKFYLQVLMDQESNWISGPLLMNLENIRLSLVLFLFIFKYRSKVKQEFYIDTVAAMIAKASALYLVNSYSCTLTILSCKFLEILARDESFPLIASLGLDSDQVQRVFLERLRDPMEDEDVKLNILNLISTCIFSQNGMTAAFFDVQCSRKWYTEVKKTNMETDTVADFMVDYLQNIKKSHEYLKCPLQVAILRITAHLWICKKQHLIEKVSSLESFWSLLADPFFRPFVQSPGVYAYILKIFCIQFSFALVKPEGNENFFNATQKLLMDKKQLLMLQKYIKSMFVSPELSDDELSDRDFLLKSFAELVVVWTKQAKVKGFPDDETKFVFVELSLDGIKLPLFNVFLLEPWLDFCLIFLKNFGLKFPQHSEVVVSKCIEMCDILQNNYRYMNLKSRKVALCIIQKILQDLKGYFESNNTVLLAFLEAIGQLVDYENLVLNDTAWESLRNGDPLGKDQIIPWTLIVIISNMLLKLKNCKECAVWFAFRNYLPSTTRFVCNVLQFKETVSAAKLAIYSLTLYINSPLYMDFLQVNLLNFYDRLEFYMANVVTGPNKVNIMDLKEGWECGIILMKFNQAFVRRFQRHSLEICYTFLTLNVTIIRHIISIPELTVDLRALDFVMQTLKFFDYILNKWTVEWCRKSNPTFSLMVAGVKKIINSCIYICLRPKHIIFYYIDSYQSLNPLENAPNELMISVINKLIGIIGLCFACLYKINLDLLDMLGSFEPDDPPVMMILNDFTVPRFELPIPEELTYGKLLCLAHFYCKTLNQLHQKKIKRRKCIVKEEDYSGYVGLVEHRDPSDNLPNQKLREYLRYAMYEYSGLMDPWIENVNYEEVNKSLELFIMFLAQQSLLTINKDLEESQLPYYKRNLCSELQFFTEYIKKRIGQLFDGPSVTTSVYSVSSHKIERDLIRRYMDYCWKKGIQTEVAEKNFMVVFYCWFHNICQVR